MTAVVGGASLLVLVALVRISTRLRRISHALAPRKPES